MQYSVVVVVVVVGELAGSGTVFSFAYTGEVSWYIVVGWLSHSFVPSRSRQRSVIISRMM